MMRSASIPFRFAAVPLWTFLGVILSNPPAPAEEGVTVGSVDYQPAENEQIVPEQFRLPAHRFEFRQEQRSRLSGGGELSVVTFPSPMETAWEPNNTIHCEYYQPALKPGEKVPGVVVLDILEGNSVLPRLFSNMLVTRRVSALYVKLPYYGPRRGPGCPRRMITDDPPQTVEGMTQAVQDIRQARAWLASREEIDSERIGIFGISLGGITSALAATAEPRFQNVCMMLAGGDFSVITWDTDIPEVANARRKWEAKGGTYETFMQLLRTVDPVTYGKNVRDRRLLMLNALDDNVIPRRCTDSLWEAFGRPEIVWFTGDHYTVVKHLPEGLTRVGDFFEQSPKVSAGEESAGASK